MADADRFTKMPCAHCKKQYHFEVGEESNASRQPLSFARACSAAHLAPSTPQTLSKRQQLCSSCRKSLPRATCRFCQQAFSQRGKATVRFPGPPPPQNVHNKQALRNGHLAPSPSQGDICPPCLKMYERYKSSGEPHACSYCQCQVRPWHRRSRRLPASPHQQQTPSSRHPQPQAAFGKAKLCSACSKCEAKYGPPEACAVCEKVAAFRRSAEAAAGSGGQLLCLLCTLKSKEDERRRERRSEARERRPGDPPSAKRSRSASSAPALPTDGSASSPAGSPLPASSGSDRLVPADSPLPLSRMGDIPLATDRQLVLYCIVAWTLWSTRPSPRSLPQRMR